MLTKQQIIDKLSLFILKYKKTPEGKPLKKNLNVIDNMIGYLEGLPDDLSPEAFENCVKEEIINKLATFETKTKTKNKIEALRTLIDQINPPQNQQDLYNITYNALKKLQLHRLNNTFLTEKSKDHITSNGDKIHQILKFIEDFKGSLDSHVCKVHIVKLLLDLVTKSNSKTAIIGELVEKFNLPQQVKEEIQTQIEKTTNTIPLRETDIEVKSDATTTEYDSDWKREIKGSGAFHSQLDTGIYFNDEKIVTLEILQQKLKDFLAISLEHQGQQNLDNLVKQVLTQLKGVDLMRDERNPMQSANQSNLIHNVRCYFQCDEQTGNVFFKRQFNGYLSKHGSKTKVWGKLESNVSFNTTRPPMRMFISSQCFVDPTIGEQDKAAEQQMSNKKGNVGGKRF